MQPTEKISALPPKATLASTDLIPIVDTSTGVTKVITGAAATLAFTTATNGWNNLNFTVTYSSNDGNKQFKVLVSGVDLTGTLSPGMKFKVTRGTTPNTQAMAFSAASSQYATKASPTGITFTSAFTCEAWVYLNSYATQFIISREDSAATNGLGFYINTSGQVVVEYKSSGAATSWNTYQTVPLSRWTHLATAVSSTSTKTLQGFYINGTSVPASAGATSATTITQSGPLVIGAQIVGSTPGNLFNGYVSEARIWSVAQSQANIQSNMGLSLTTATNLVFNIPGNGNFNDLSGNGNNLTGVNGAIATQAANPANLIEYAVITAVSYSAPNTTITLFAGTDCVIPNMTLSGAQYSTVRSPYGFPAARGKWVVSLLNRANATVPNPTASAWYNPNNLSLNIPVGEWTITSKVNLYQSKGGVSEDMVSFALGTSTTSPIAESVVSRYGSTNPDFMTTHTSVIRYSQTAAANLLLLIGTARSSTPNIALRPDVANASFGSDTVEAECAYI